MTHPSDAFFAPPERPEYKMVHIRLPQELYDRFVHALPMHGAVSWFVRDSMECFLRELADQPQHALARSMNEFTRALTTGRREIILNELEETHEN
jgi:hypothetical protein